MKKIVLLACAALTLQVAAAQQLDRSKKPEPGPAPVIRFADPVIFTMDNGMTVLIVENHKLPKVSANYSIDTGPVTEGSKAGMIDLLSGMMREGTTTKTKAQFDAAADQIGASLDVYAGGGQVSALTPYFEQAFLLMADALRNPAFPASSFDKIKTQTITGLRSNEKSASEISARVVSALSFGSTHPFGEFVTEKSIAGLTLRDIRTAYQKYVGPSRGYLTFVGDISPRAARALAVKAFGSWRGGDLRLPKLEEVKNPVKTIVNVVDVPNAVQSEITVTNLINLPMSSPDYHAVLLANQILGGGADSKLFRNLREQHGFTYGAYAKTGAGRYQSSFSATASVRNEKADSAVVEFIREINNMRETKVDPVVLAEAKNLYNGTFALNLENPAVPAAFASTILINKLPRDFYRTYLRKINAVTADDVLRVSRKYFLTEGTRIIIVGKTDDFAPGLMKSGFRVSYFDPYAHPVPNR